MSTATEPNTTYVATFIACDAPRMRPSPPASARSPFSPCLRARRADAGPTSSSAADTRQKNLQRPRRLKRNGVERSPDAARAIPQHAAIADQESGRQIQHQDRAREPPAGRSNHPAQERHGDYGMKFKKTAGHQRQEDCRQTAGTDMRQEGKRKRDDTGRHHQAKEKPCGAGVLVQNRETEQRQP